MVNKIYTLILGIFVCALLAIPNALLASSCESDFSYSFPNSSSYSTVSFQNLSLGDYEFASWDFGDDTYSSSLDGLVDHTYASLGFYDVCLTIWGGSCNQSSTYCLQIFVGPDDLMCAYTDCVFPGDANGDNKVDYYDLLNIGVGLGTQGILRPGASIEWVGQPAPDWSNSLPNGINYKHLDSDGNGTIEAIDMLPLVLYYSSMENDNITYEWNGGLVYLEFDQDTFYLGDYPNGPIPISASVYLGSEDNPFDDIHGAAFYISYPDDFFQSDDVIVDYQDSYFGTYNDDALLYFNNQADDNQLDVGLTRISGTGASGHGKVASIEFIVESDVVAARNEQEVPLEFSMGGVFGVNDEGQVVDLNINSQQPSVLFINDLNANNTPALSDRLQVSPNPVSDILTIEASGLSMDEVQLLDLQGKTWYSLQPQRSKIGLDMAYLPAGIYVVKVKTPEGWLVQKVLK